MLGVDLKWHFFGKSFLTSINMYLWGVHIDNSQVLLNGGCAHGHAHGVWFIITGSHVGGVQNGKESLERAATSCSICS